MVEPYLTLPLPLRHYRICPSCSALPAADRRTRCTFVASSALDHIDTTRRTTSAPPPYRMARAAHLIGSSVAHPMHLMVDSRFINDDLCHCGFVPDDEDDTAQADGDGGPNT
jgi:hypothetical protein